jgi:hypothetical protein
MADVKGVRTTKYDAGPSGDNAIPQGFVNAQLEVWSDVYNASALADPSVIDIAELPEGAKVKEIFVTHGALGAGTTLDIGDGDTSDRYTSAAADTSAAGTFRSDQGTQYQVGAADGDTRIKLFLAGGAATGQIESTVYFTR